MALKTSIALRRKLLTILILWASSMQAQTPVQLQVQDLRPFPSTEEDRYKLWNLFNATGGSTDPLHGTTSFSDAGTLTHALPAKNNAIYTPGPAEGYKHPPGGRFFADMTGAKDRCDTSNKVFITNIYGYSNTFDAGDTLEVYCYDTAFTRPANERWKFRAYPDSLLPKIGVLITQGGGSGGWQNFAPNKAVRYLLFRYKLSDHGTYFLKPDYEKIIIYGYPLYDPNALTKIQKTYSGSRASAPNYKSFSRYVATQGIDTNQTKQFGGSKVFGDYKYFDTGNTNVLTKIRADYFPAIGNSQYASYKRNGQKFWWVLLGCSPYITAKAPAGWYFNTDEYMDNPESPYSYSRLAAFCDYYALRHGRNSTAGTIYDDNGANGRNDQDGVIIINEPNFHLVNDAALFAMYTAAFDGYEGRVGMGGKYGIMAADSLFNLVLAGPGIRDTMEIDNVIWLAETDRTDKRVPAHIITYHQYDVSGGYNYIPDVPQQIGIHGESPERSHSYSEDSAFVTHTYARYGKYIEIGKAEYGYGADSISSTTEGEAGANWDWGNTPHVAYLNNSSALRAAWFDHAEDLMMASGLSFSHWFALHNNSFSTTFGNGLFGWYGMGNRPSEGTGNPMDSLYATYYVKSFKTKYMGDYHFERFVVRSDTGHIVIKFRSNSDPTKVLLKTWVGSYYTTPSGSKDIPLGNHGASVVTRMYNLTDSTGRTVSPSITGNTMTISNLGYESVYIFLTEPTIGPVDIRSRNRVRINKN